MDELNKERLKDCRNIVSAAMPTVLKRLVKTATDEKERAYARNQASAIISNHNHISTNTSNIATNRNNINNLGEGVAGATA